MGDLDPVTLILKLDLNMVKIYCHTENKGSVSAASKVIAQTHTQRHRHTQT